MDCEAAIPQSVNWLVEIARIAIPVLFVVIGWHVVSTGNDKRETRKEKRQLVDKTIKLIDEIVEDSIGFFTSDDDEAAEGKAGKILADLKRIEVFLQALSLNEQVNGAFSDITAAELRKAVTSDGLFWIRPRTKLSLSNGLVILIRTEAMQLVAKLETSYIRLYKD